LWPAAFACLVFVIAFACIAQDRRPGVAPTTPPIATPSSTAPPESVAISQTTGTGQKSQAENQRRKQISTESTQLLAMAVELKAEVDKSNKDTLSLKVIRKADAIEKLAKTVKEKEKQGRGPG
jgi:hypothetical protein